MKTELSKTETIAAVITALVSLAISVITVWQWIMPAIEGR